MSALLEVRGVSKRFGRAVALDDIHLDIAEGLFFALVGPSGSGKTTLLHILGGFVEPDRGRVFIAGSDVTDMPPAGRPTTSVFQDYALFPHMSVASNVGFGLRMRKVPRRHRSARVTAALEMVGLGSMGGRYVHQLSGGQRQRVALARALVVEPKVLLLDEPLGALDVNLRRQMQEELLHIQKKIGTTFVHVTHDQEEAMSVADVIAVMNQGRIEDVGPPRRVYLKPQTLFTAGFMGESNTFAGKVVAAGAGRIQVACTVGRLGLNGEAAVGAEVHLAVRPEQLFTRDSDGGDRLGLGQFVAREVTFFGTHQRCVGELAPSGQPLIVRLPPHRSARAGDALSIFVNREDIVVLDR
jgi:spermidine/putrescine transport system ATP-binding protein